MLRLRFRVHTLLIVVALMASWLAWQSLIVSGRRAKLDWIVDGRAAFVLTVDDSSPSGADQSGLPIWRRWMGDKRVDRLMLLQELVSARDVDAIREIFPEADVQVMTLSAEKTD